MARYLIALAIAGAMSAQLAAQTAPQSGTTEAQQAKAETVKKRVCTTKIDRLHNIQKVCRTVTVPAEKPSDAEQAPNAGTGEK